MQRWAGRLRRRQSGCGTRVGITIKAIRTVVSLPLENGPIVADRRRADCCLLADVSIPLVRRRYEGAEGQFHRLDVAWDAARADRTLYNHTPLTGRTYDRTMALDPIVSLAVALAESPGACACLLGAGVSVDAGVPTGWAIFRDGLRRLYRLDTESDHEPEDPELDEWLRATGRGGSAIHRYST